MRGGVSAIGALCACANRLVAAACAAEWLGGACISGEAAAELGGAKIVLEGVVRMLGRERRRDAAGVSGGGAAFVWVIRDAGVHGFGVGFTVGAGRISAAGLVYPARARGEFAVVEP